MSGGTRRAAVWALAVLCSLAPAAADGNIGCLFSASLCADKVEWCFDDFAFGKCIPIYDEEVEDSTLHKYNMSAEELNSFETVLQNLLSLGYRWDNAYTQCVLQAMLLSSRQNLKTVNMKVCEQFSDPGIISEAKSFYGDPDVRDKPMDTEEVAYVRFTPNNSPVSDSDFANKVYAPPVNIKRSEPIEEFSSKELVYHDGDNSNGANSDIPGKFRVEKSDPLETFRRGLLAGTLDEAAVDYADSIPETGKIMTSFYPNDGDIDDETYAAAVRSIANSRKLDADVPPYTTEYITANRFSPGESRVLSSTMNRYLERFRTKEFPFEYEDDSNDIPESRVYNDDDDEMDADLGSGFNPNKLQIKDDALTETQKANMEYLLALWKNDLLQVKEREHALYAEGGPMTMDQSTGNNEPPLSGAELHGILSNYDWGFKRRERLDVKKPGPRLDIRALMFKYKKNLTESSQPHTTPVKKGSHDYGEFSVDPSFAYVMYDDPKGLEWDRGKKIIKKIEQLLGLQAGNVLTHPRVDKGEVTFKVENNSKKMNATDVARSIENIKDQLNDDFGITVLAAGVGDKTKGPAIVRAEEAGFLNNRDSMLVVLVACGCMVVVAGVAMALLVRRDARARRKLAGLASAAEIDAEATQDYQELCRARMTGKWSGQQTGVASGAVCGGDAPQRLASLSRDPDHVSPSQRSSTSSWSEEPALTNMDISTGHMVLAYMEDHLKNKDRLEQEWAGLCAYEAEPCATTAASADDNLNKNRNPDVLPYDHSRVTLNTLTNHLGSDYINASTITDHDPRNPAYIAAQGPLPHTAADFWQMVWEQGSVVMVMLTRLTENGTQMCHRFWPEEASELHHIYEVHLVSEHIWCDDYLVRSFYLKNQRTGETRTVTQFHFLSWPDAGVPASIKALLEFRRKVNKSYRGRSCPIVVHCSDGASRTGTYCLIDMVLNRMAKGAKEIDIAATLEHIRDQRPRMVTTKQQFEFVLMAVAEEVHAILKSLPAQLQQQSDKNKEAAEKDKNN